MKTISVSVPVLGGGRGVQLAKIDDEDFDRVSMHNWFLDQSHIYAKMTFDSGRKKPYSRTFNLKVRLDYFVFNYSPYINLRIAHRNGDLFDCQKSNLETRIKDPGTPMYRRTGYLGVMLIEGRLKKGNEGLYLTVQHEKYINESSPMDEGDDAKDLAAYWDRYTRHKKGNDARTNFLLPPLIRKKDVAQGDSEEAI